MKKRLSYFLSAFIVITTILYGCGLPSYSTNTLISEKQPATSVRILATDTDNSIEKILNVCSGIAPYRSSSVNQVAGSRLLEITVHYSDLSGDERKELVRQLGLHPDVRDSSIHDIIQ